LGTLQGKDNVRAYWSKALSMIPNLHFKADRYLCQPRQHRGVYQNERGAKICEYLRLDAAGKIRHGSANHLAH